jgi:uroporphyrinogen-III synthase
MKVFISRHCPEESVFYRTLSQKGIEVSGNSLIEFYPVPMKLPPFFDWIFFYSKTAVEYFFNAFPKISSNPKIAALGPGTAEAILKFSGNAADFCGDGNPENTAAAFQQVAAGQTVLFVRAQESKLSVQTVLQNKLNVLELIAYRNSIKTDVSETDADILVFTSSMNAKAYLQKYQLKNYQKIVAIGKPTADSLAELGIEQVITAKTPDEASLAAAVFNIIF